MVVHRKQRPAWTTERVSGQLGLHREPCLEESEGRGRGRGEGEGGEGERERIPGQSPRILLLLSSSSRLISACPHVWLFMSVLRVDRSLFHFAN